jgi:hypothetical protein
MDLLTAKYPKGLRCTFYDTYFGTLHSMVFDVTGRIVYICFGTPEKSKWHAFRVQDEIRQECYPVSLEREQAPSDFYQLIPEL